VKWLSFAAVVALCACNSPLSQTSVGPATAGAQFGRHSGSTPIKHVIVIMQENRSFNNLFYGFPGAKTFATGNGHGKTYQMHEIPLKWRYDLNHSITARPTDSTARSSR
jgi:phospholipase C